MLIMIIIWKNQNTLLKKLLKKAVYEIEALTTEDIFNRLQIQNKGFMIYKFEYTLKE